MIKNLEKRITSLNLSKFLKEKGFDFKTDYEYVNYGGDKYVLTGYTYNSGNKEKIKAYDIFWDLIISNGNIIFNGIKNKDKKTLFMDIVNLIEEDNTELIDNIIINAITNKNILHLFYL